tara:strand:+ start:2038 stop:2178 length:141 start_codon:yes stop_codon:yes gene_type:complete
MYSNAWLRKTREASLIQIVEWAHRSKILIEDLTEENIREALRDKDD